jgi:hypothetical protein
MNQTLNLTNPPAFVGILHRESPLRDIFRTGEIPLTGLTAEVVKLEQPDGSVTKGDVYFLKLDAVNETQKELLVRRSHDMGQGPIEECRAAVAKGPLPIRALHIASVSASTRLFT